MKKILAIAVAVVVASCLVKTYSDDRLNELDELDNRIKELKITSDNIEKEIEKALKPSELQLEWLRKGHLAG